MYDAAAAVALSGQLKWALFAYWICQNMKTGVIHSTATNNCSVLSIYAVSDHTDASNSRNWLKTKFLHVLTLSIR